ncbi:MAG: hypothetical protein ACLFMX_02900 [Halobacteriales archaeon]
MAPSIPRTIDALLEGVQSTVDDADASYRLRTARQLLVILDEQVEASQAALEMVDLDPDTQARLRELGYLD